MAQDDLEFIKAVRALDEASKRLNAGADKLFDGQKLTDKVFDKFGLGQAREFQKKTSEFLSQRKLRRQQEREVRQRLGGKDPISKATFKQLKKEAELTKKKEAVDAAFKSFVETNLGLNEQLLNQLRFIQDVKKDSAGNLRDRKGKFSSFDAPEKFLKKTIDESEFNRQFVDKMGLNKQDLISGGIAGAKSPGDKNRAAEEERRSDQQAFEMEKTESTNDILRDILAALTDNSPLKKDEKDNSGLLAGLGAGAGLANLLGSLGKLGKLLLLGGPLLLGIAGLTYGLSELSDMADKVTKKVVDDTKKQTKAIEDAKTEEQARKAILGKENRVNEAERRRQRDTMTSAPEKQALLQTGADRAEVTLAQAEKFDLVKNSKSFNEIIASTTQVLNAARDASIRDGNTIEARYASFDKVLAETIVKIKGSKTFLDADEKNQKFMIQQVVAQANKALAGAGNKSVLLSGLGPEALKGQAAIETRRARAMMALQGGRGKFAEEGFGYLSDRLGGGRNIFSRSQVKLLEARVAEAQKDADEVTFLEKYNPFGSGNQGDIDRLNSLTQELARLRDAIATVGGNTVVAPNNSVNTVNNSSAQVYTPFYMTDPNTEYQRAY